MSIVICNICGKQHKGNFETCTSCITKEQQMSIEIGQKYIGKNGEVVEVYNITETVGRDEVIYYKCEQGKSHILYDYDFLEQYKPYEEPKQTVVIEKWLVTNGKRFDVAETSDIDVFLGDGIGWRQAKLIDTYEVKL